tara:strand:- start:1372 stop:1536 length:165 start_codon:yes stop_codon:yes gene_type:complete
LHPTRTTGNHLVGPIAFLEFAKVGHKKSDVNLLGIEGLSILFWILENVIRILVI